MADVPNWILESKDSTQYVRAIWNDMSNLLRSKAVHINQLGLLNGLRQVKASFVLPAWEDTVPPDSGVGAVGEVKFVPDWSTCRRLPYCENHLSTFGTFVTEEGEPWALCTRTFLIKALKEAEEKLKLEIKVGFEEEFIVNFADGRPFDETTYCDSRGLDNASTFLTDLTDALIKQGVQPYIFHSEAAQGQLEMSIMYDNALEAADNHIRFRSTVHAIARKHNLKVNFMPKLSSTAIGSGLHCHISIHRNGENLFEMGDQTLSSEPYQFIAGVLNHLPSLLAVLAPTTNSYRRIQPHTWSGAYQCWGRGNREAAIRLLDNNFEIKTSDATSNVYLGLGLIIYAGLDGIVQKRKLPPATVEDPEEPMFKRLPSSLDESLGIFSKNIYFQSVMGPQLFKAYTALKKFELEAFKGKSIEEEVKILREKF
eukprot:NODE_3143_length_1414_cov_62.835012_g2730_i0.p1 GENE.NODE_3143_length_1414_cov_62.835012_g2730_i0~~NODE_3143_length_1414_cov_62.835012_g2730_i0.p1  ORF type:complete len:426 (-),score=76.16 NODE_3143_length_1414_cov_62.835012_g2730_i0:84-1361(-)